MRLKNGSKALFAISVIKAEYNRFHRGHIIEYITILQRKMDLCVFVKDLSCFC